MTERNRGHCDEFADTDDDALFALPLRATRINRGGNDWNEAR